MKSIVVSMITAAGLMVAGSAMATDMPPLAKKNNCTACHAVDKKVVGPAWMDVSKKYKGATKYTYGGKEYPLLEGLMMKVSKGGSGNWGSMPMPANDPAGTKQADIKELVTFELGLAK
jgi:cytochrome c551/c552